VTLKEPHLLIRSLLFAGTFGTSFLLSIGHFRTTLEFQCSRHLRLKHLWCLFEPKGELITEGDLLVKIQLKSRIRCSRLHVLLITAILSFLIIVVLFSKDRVFTCVR